MIGLTILDPALPPGSTYSSYDDTIIVIIVINLFSIIVVIVLIMGTQPFPFLLIHLYR